jgi:Flp pilus assembly protein TadG
LRRPQSGWRQFPKRTDGISAVEFALLLPVMLLIVCGIMDFGNLYFQAHIANEAAREAARLGAITKQNQATVQATIRGEYGNALILTFNPNPPATGGTVTAKVTNAVTILTPIISQIIPNNPTTVTGQSVMQVEN